MKLSELLKDDYNIVDALGDLSYHCSDKPRPMFEIKYLVLAHSRGKCLPDTEIKVKSGYKCVYLDIIKDEVVEESKLEEWQKNYEANQ